MKKPSKADSGFTIIELLVVIAIIAVLTALMFPALSRAHAKAKRTACTNNLRQINLAVRMYSDDSHDASPSPGSTAALTNPMALYSGYRALIKNYVGLKSSSSPQDKLFACPADAFYPGFFSDGASPPEQYVQKSFHDAAFSDYSSYVFNGGDNLARQHPPFTIWRPGLTGVKLSAVKHPARTALVSEGSAPCPWSWHDPAQVVKFNDAKNVLSFVDGHVGYIKIYWNSTLNGGRSQSFMYDPPADYNYQWSPN